MKTCTEFHVENVEPGDKLHFGDPDRLREFGDPYPSGDMTVRSLVRTNNFGWIITGTNGVEYHYDDYDTVTFVE